MNHLHQAFCQEPPVFIQPRQTSPSQTAAPPQFVPAAAPIRPEPNVGQLKVDLKKRLIDRYQKLQQELAGETDRVLAQNNQLCEGEGKLKKAQGTIRTEILKISEEAEQDRARNDSLMDQIQRLKSDGELNIDKLVISQGPISKQYQLSVCSQY